MRRDFLLGSLIGALLVGTAALAYARARRPPRRPPAPGPARLAATPVIVVGRVTAAEPKDLPTELQPGFKAAYRVVIVTVTEVIKGPRDLETLRLGFLLPPGPGVQVRRGSPWYYLDPWQQFAVGQDGLFYLHKSPQGFYQVREMFDFVPRSAPQFLGETAIDRLAARDGSDLARSLKSDKAEDRFHAAAGLILRYRDPGSPGPRIKPQPIDAAESKLILAALQEGDWKQNGDFSPLRLFLLLGLTPADGWTAPVNLGAYQPQARAWLRQHGDTYRIQRIVP